MSSLQVNPVKPIQEPIVPVANNIPLASEYNIPDIEIYDITLPPKLSDSSYISYFIPSFIFS